MSLIRYQFKLKKLAVLSTPAGPMQIGQVEEYSDIDGVVSIAVRLNPGLDNKFVETFEKNPQLISIVGEPGKVENIIIIPTIEIPNN